MSAFDRLQPTQRICIDVETFEGKPSCYATLYDKDMETPENEDGFVAAAEILGTTSMEEILLKLFEDPDVSNG